MYSFHCQSGDSGLSHACSFPDEELKAPAWAPTNIQDPDKDEVVWALFKERVAGKHKQQVATFLPLSLYGGGSVWLTCWNNVIWLRRGFDRSLRKLGESGCQPISELPRSINVVPENGRATECLQLDQKETLDLANSIIESVCSSVHLNFRQIARGTRIIDQGLATQDLAQSTGSGTGLVSDSTPPKSSLRRSPNLCAALHYPNRLRRAEDSTTRWPARSKYDGSFVLHLLELLEGLEKDDIIHISCVIPTCYGPGDFLILLCYSCCARQDSLECPKMECMGKSLRRRMTESDWLAVPWQYFSNTQTAPEPTRLLQQIQVISK
ncbi:hypothetical protein R3P38DRAFT_2777282 [Favolaschia claudopus]|uniref:Uncharacterized protein n=1 Tax=Favolaschia claudopus TaxID=2862362 RepID=A0AAW0BPG7_9AGAR